MSPIEEIKIAITKEMIHEAYKSMRFEYAASEDIYAPGRPPINHRIVVTRPDGQRTWLGGDDGVFLFDSEEDAREGVKMINDWKEGLK